MSRQTSPVVLTASTLQVSVSVILEVQKQKDDRGCLRHDCIAMTYGRRFVALPTNLSVLASWRAVGPWTRLTGPHRIIANCLRLLRSRGSPVRVVPHGRDMRRCRGHAGESGWHWEPGTARSGFVTGPPRAVPPWPFSGRRGEAPPNRSGGRPFGTPCRPA